ncbi:MAG: ABC transporter permease, partial [Cyclobacteriaceae bacterium]|nr:ABC transporter permease [Cyclobacteriaceae bacterium HetDA_MAG_MS6]
MISGFIKTATRNIRKNKVFALINFTGLISGITLSLLIFTYLREELTYDTFHEKIDRIYRLKYHASNGMQLAAVPPPIAPRMEEYFPEVEKAARTFRRNMSISFDARSSQESFEQENVFFADSALLDILTFDFVAGDRTQALREPFTVILTEETAQRYFGDTNPIGKVITFSGQHDFRVNGLIKNLPSNSHLDIAMLVPYRNMYDIENEETAERMRSNLAVNFVISHSHTYVLLKQGSGPGSVNSNIQPFLEKYAKPTFLVGQNFELTPVRDIHLDAGVLIEPTPTTDKSTIYIFLSIGVLTLLIASINFINLSTAQSFSRIKEIGIRRVLGSGKRQLIMQFMTETFVFCLAAFICSFFLFELLLPILNDLTNKNFTFLEELDVQMLGFSAGVLVLITLLAGIYPSFFATGFNTISALKGKSIQSFGKGNLFRKSLVTFQLIVASFLLVSSMIIFRQLDYLVNRPLGFDKEQVVNIRLFSSSINNVFGNNTESFRQKLHTYVEEISQQAFILSSTQLSTTMGGGATYRGTIPEGFTREDNMFQAHMAVDYDFVETFGLEVIAGRSFDRSYGSDVTEAFMVNETAVKVYDWGSNEEAIGRSMNVEGRKGKVIGVVKDFHFSDLSTPLSPVTIEVDPIRYTALAVKVAPGQVKAAVDFMEKTWNGMFPEKAFELDFLDEFLTQQYANYENFGMMIRYFTMV